MPKLPNILVTGTPGTGKTTFADMIAVCAVSLARYVGKDWNASHYCWRNSNHYLVQVYCLGQTGAFQLWMGWRVPMHDCWWKCWRSSRFHSSFSPLALGLLGTTYGRRRHCFRASYCWFLSWTVVWFGFGATMWQYTALWSSDGSVRFDSCKHS